jgi:hypothetical protein
MSGADYNIEQLTHQRSMTVGEFACAHADVGSGLMALCHEELRGIAD